MEFQGRKGRKDNHNIVATGSAPSAQIFTTKTSVYFWNLYVLAFLLFSFLQLDMFRNQRFSVIHSHVLRLPLILIFQFLRS